MPYKIGTYPILGWFIQVQKNEAFKAMQINDHTFGHFKLYHCTSATQGL